jgi:hypothetical protein
MAHRQAVAIKDIILTEGTSSPRHLRSLPIRRFANVLTARNLFGQWADVEARALVVANPELLTLTGNK